MGGPNNHKHPPAKQCSFDNNEYGMCVLVENARLYIIHIVDRIEKLKLFRCKAGTLIWKVENYQNSKPRNNILLQPLHLSQTMVNNWCRCGRNRCRGNRDIETTGKMRFYFIKSFQLLKQTGVWWWCEHNSIISKCSEKQNITFQQLFSLSLTQFELFFDSIFMLKTVDADMKSITKCLIDIINLVWT